jgi:DNA mismatch repair protein MutS
MRVNRARFSASDMPMIERIPPTTPQASYDASRPMAAEGARPTPMMAQYIEIKAANADSLLFYRMGDFYEMFFEDAEIASRTLGIVLTKRGKHQGDDIPMCGVPVERADDYLQRLIAAGHRVAVCEQTEDPAEARKRGGKSVVRRDVVRLVTPGTITEERLLEPGQANLFVALARRHLGEDQQVFGLAAVDISTGLFTVMQTDAGGLGPALARLDPREIICPDALHEDVELRQLWRETSAAVTAIARDGLDQSAAERRLTSFFGVSTLDAFGAFTPVEIAAAALAVIYVERTQLGVRPPLSPPVREQPDAAMQIDGATRANLELMRTLSGNRAGSLLAAIDRTVTSSGGRLLAERLAGPLTDLAAIAGRHDSVAHFIAEPGLRDDLRRALSGIGDLSRALSRLALERGGPRDLLALGQGLDAASAVAARLQSGRDLPAPLAEAARYLGGFDPAIARQLMETLADEVPLSRRDGGFVRAGFDAELDELRLLQVDSRKVIAALQGRYSADTGVRQLKIKHNNVLGFFLKEPWRDVFVHRQTMADVMRFTSIELGELEARIASAADRALRREAGFFEALRALVMAQAMPIKALADALAQVDVAAALADLAADLGWCRPVIEDSLAFVIEGGRHPVVEAALKRDGKSFIANNCNLSGSQDAGGGAISLVTGPNMAGKSTFLRQNALIAILAQMGSFVPASVARIGIVDRLFSRVGAADDLARGRSTFMVEMVETAAILNQAGTRALVILDEIGRGTATFDGLSIAWAAIEHLHGNNGCRALFATHYHELTALAERLPRVSNATMRVTEWNGDVVFLHEVVAGAADRSYGIQVARLAGLPMTVVERAKAILHELEKSEREKPVAALVDDLPLFAAPVRQVEPRVDLVGEALGALDLDDLTPRQALDELYRLKRLAGSAKR